MLISETSDIVVRHKANWQESPFIIDLVYLKGGRVLAIAPTSISLYKNEESINNPLSNGLISSADWPNEHALTLANKADNVKGLVKSYKAGVIQLHQQKTLLITPVSIQLFLNNHDALNNRDAIAYIDIA
jgi:hypothetical protein